MLALKEALMCHRVSLFFTCIFCLFFLLSSTAHAWMILHGFSDPCHETMVLQSYDFVLKDLNIEDIYPPQDEISSKVFDSIGDELDLGYTEELHEFLIGSMILGVRRPDMDGHSMLDFNRARAMHIAENSQSNHGLRSSFDDGEEGNTRAILAARKKIEEFLEKSLFYSSGPLDERYIKVSHPLEYYGNVDITVYAPAYYLGVAMHIFQDTFSHTIRSDDLHQIYHVMNYVDAASVGHDEERDGLAHSVSMDDCFGAASEIAEIATIATSELMRAFMVDYTTGRDDAVDQVLDDWLEYKPGCTMQNDYCGSRWVEIARQKQTKPILEEVFGCSLSDRSMSNQLLMLILFVFIAFRGMKNEKIHKR